MRSTGGKRKRPPSNDNLASLVQSGPIGQCLQEALNDLVSESFVEEMEQEVGDSTGQTPSTIFDKSMADCVMNSFGRAVADSEWNDAPAALLRGRVDYYNKMNDKWRIVVQDAQLRPRLPLSKKNATRLQKKTLWVTSISQQGTTMLNGPLQILAYNDS